MTAVKISVQEGFYKSQYKSHQTTGCWPRVWSCALSFIALALLLFSLYGRHGDFRNSSEKNTGLHKQCLQSKTTGEVVCSKQDEIKMNIRSVEVEVSKVFVCSTLVFCLFALLSFGLSLCFQDSNDRPIWKFGVFLITIAATALSAGIIAFLCAAADIGLALWICMAADAVLIGNIFVSWSVCREQNHSGIAVAI